MAKKQNKNCKNCNNNICQCNSKISGIVHEAIQISIPGEDFSNMSKILIDVVNGQELAGELYEVIDEPTYVPFKVNETKFKDKYFQRLILKPIRDIAKLPSIKVFIEFLQE